jgi:hypothetical protein
MSLKELLTLIVAIPLLLFLANLFPQTHIILFVLWMFYLGFDIASTYSFYLEDPSQFQNNERNTLFVWFTKKFGFKKTVLLFPLLIEVPLLLFFAYLPLQSLHTYIFPDTSNNLWACLAASFGISSIGHLQAALKNTKLNHKHHKKPGHASK